MKTVVASFMLLASLDSVAADPFFEELSAISFIESNHGKYLEHREITKGLNKGTRAGGAFGLMPITVRDLVSRIRALKAKYSRLLSLSNNEITAELNRNKDMDREIATTFWKKLRLKFSPRRAAYAWLHGPSAAARQESHTVLQAQYVQKFHNYILINFKSYEFATNP